MRGFIFGCTNKSVKEMLENGVFYTKTENGWKVMAVRDEDEVFLYNLDTDVLYGVFRKAGEWGYEKKKYPYSLKVRAEGKVLGREGAKRLFRKNNITWKDVLTEEGCRMVRKFLEEGIITKTSKPIIKNPRPPLYPTTLWDFPTQSYGDKPKGDNKYPGVTPAFVIYNLIYRYTEPGDVVCDPMAGSGTTLDVCREEGREAVCFDIQPVREDILQADARNLPLEDGSVDMVFVDPPYGDNIRYNEHPDDIGKIPATSEKYYEEIEKVVREGSRVLKDEGVFAILVGDQWARGVFVPVGMRVYEIVSRYFVPVDIVVVARHNQTSNTNKWQALAIEKNFYLRGFKYLIIARKTKKVNKVTRVKWREYER